LTAALPAAAAEPRKQPVCPPSEAASKLKERLTAAASENRHRLAFDGRVFSGPGWDLLVKEGAAAQFFMLGEEHGVAEIPALARELLLALKPAGYSKLAIEISGPVAAELDRAALGGVEGVRKFNAEFPPGPAFYYMKEEAEFIAAARAAFPKSASLIWGLDYEVLQDRRLIAQLRTRAPASARAAVEALHQACAASWQKFNETRNPQFLFSFSGDPALVDAVIAAWPNPSAEAEFVLEVLKGTLEANALWVKGQGWASNERRTRLLRGSFVRYWRAEKARGRTPKTLFKFGASHVARGRDMSEVYDIGDLVAEAAALEGGSSFHLFAGPPRTAKHAQFNPSTMSVVPAPAGYFDEQAVGFLADLAYPDGYTLIDLRALRPVLDGRTKDLDVRAVRVILGLDAMLVMTGATPAVML
jgi:hypothetical protein